MPVVSEKQRRAMWAAAKGRSTLGIPRSVGKEYVGADEAIRRAAGIAFTLPTREALFVRRGAEGDHAGEWCFPGGIAEGDESPEQTAMREATEEVGRAPGDDVDLIGNTIDETGVHFLTFRHDVDERFEPTLNDENTEHTWAPLDDPPNPLHPGVAAVLRAMAMDAAGPRTLYVNRKLMNAADVIAWARGQGFENPDLADTMHVTVAYSTAPVDWDAIDPAPDAHVVNGGKRKVEELGEGAIVLRFESPSLVARWREFGAAGATWDYPSYKPHVTISHEGVTDLSAVEPYAGALEFGPERFAEVGGKAADAMNAKLLIAFDRILPGLMMAGTVHALRARTGLAFDRGSVRSYRKDGALDVASSNISKACVNPYVGHEIPGWQELGLKPDKIYKLLRDPEELAKGAPTFNNLPILTEHVAISADDHKPDLVVGTTGSGANFAHPFLSNNLVLWARRGIDLVESEEQKELSSSYHYRADMTPGEFEGEAYDGVMRDIVGNHVALVEQGRAGDDVVVGDSMEMVLMATKSLKFSHTASVALGALAVFLAPKLAMDAKVDISPSLAGVTAKNFKEKKPAIADALKKLTAGKLAKDESLEGVIALLDKLEQVGVGDEAGLEANSALPLGSITDPDEEALDADPMAAAISFAKSKLAGEDLAEFEKLCAGSAMDAEETDAEKAERLKKEKDKPGANDEPPLFKGKPEVGKGPPITKKAMDAAIAAAVTAGQAETVKTQTAIREAEKAVRPYVGELSVAFDSAADVYRAALKGLGVEGTDDIHESALPTILAMQPKPGAKLPKAPLAHDAAAGSDFAKRFPETARIRTL